MEAAQVALLLVSLFAFGHGWKCTEAPTLSRASQIDAGLGQVVAVTRYGTAFSLTGSFWSYLRINNIKHITVGPAGTWATSRYNQVYKLVAGNFTVVQRTRLTQVDAGGGEFVVGSTGRLGSCLNRLRAFPFKGIGLTYWQNLSTKYRFKYYSCGSLGCWAVTTTNLLYQTDSVSATTCSTSAWRRVSSGYTVVEASTEGQVFAITTSGKVHQRIGITSTKRRGTRWKNIPMCVAMKHLSYDLGRLWVVSGAGLVMFCTH